MPPGTATGGDYGSWMTSITREELRDSVDDLIDRVESGESFTITHDDVPVAELRPHGGTVSGP